jgi:hypothetical protein
MKFKLLTVAFAALAFTACGDTAANNSNARTNGNANTGVLKATPTATPLDCSKLSKEEYEKNKAKCEESKGSSSIGQGVNDSWLWTKTRLALAAADDLRDSTINVDVANDAVTLKGTVATAAQKTSAEKVAKGVEGVKSVKNELQVKPSDSATNQAINGNSKPTPANTNMKK